VGLVARWRYPGASAATDRARFIERESSLCIASHTDSVDEVDCELRVTDTDLERLGVIEQLAWLDKVTQRLTTRRPGPGRWAHDAAEIIRKDVERAHAIVKRALARRRDDAALPLWSAAGRLVRSADAVLQGFRTQERREHAASSRRTLMIARKRTAQAQSEAACLRPLAEERRRMRAKLEELNVDRQLERRNRIDAVRALAQSLQRRRERFRKSKSETAREIRKCLDLLAQSRKDLRRYLVEQGLNLALVSHELALAEDIQRQFEALPSTVTIRTSYLGTARRKPRRPLPKAHSAENR
jgi:hypothetical protein